MSEEIMDNQHHLYGKLSPRNDLANMDVYNQAIEYALSDRDIRNIAISGAYCSGKSSVISSYEKKANQKFVHISLAHFQSAHTSKLKEDILPVLEGKILNQLIHQIQEKDIPLTNFPIKRTPSRSRILIRTLLTVLYLLTFLHLFFSYTWIRFVSTFQHDGFRNLLEVTTHPVAFLISGVFGACILGCAIYRCIATQKLRRYIKRLNLHGNEIELFDKDHESVFDKYLDEILYLFEAANIDTVVFEDLDRYEMELIFEQLREVNTLANLRRERRNKKKNGNQKNNRRKHEKPVLKFIYLLRDDLFLSKDRTKFFDYIIPVVPVISPANAYSQLREHLNGDPILGSENRHFLQDIALYIDDMRLLKNICHEYRIYAAQLKPSGIPLNCAKLFAMVSYKNTFPTDHTLLQCNQGFVYTVFDAKEALQEESAQTHQAELTALQEQLKASEQESLASRREVMNLFALQCFPSYDVSSILQKTDEELDQKIRRILKDSVQEYEQRLSAVDHLNEKNRKPLEHQTMQLDKKLQAITRQKVWELLSQRNGNVWLENLQGTEKGQITAFPEVKHSHYFRLLKYLILNGYLDEHYSDYLTYFYHGDLDPSDKIYVMSVKDRQKSPYTYELHNPGRVLEHLRPADFDYPETLNFSLLTYLIRKQRNSDFIKHLIAQLKQSRNYSFIIAYLEATTETGRFVNVLNREWNDFIEDAYYEDALPDTVFRKFTVDTLLSCRHELLKTLNQNQVLSTYISNFSNYLNIPNPNTKVLISAFQCLGVSFTSIAFEYSDKELFDAVYHNSLYALNMDNINLMLLQKYDIPNDNALLSQNYTLICKNPRSPLYRYVHDHINEYFQEMLQYASLSIHDDLHCVLYALNNSQLSLELKTQYIRVLTTPIPELAEVRDPSLWGMLLDQSLVESSPGNLMAYWRYSKTLDGHLISYLNRYDIPIRLLGVLEETEAQLFFDQVSRCNEIQDQQYIALMRERYIRWDSNFNIQGLSEEKMMYLIEYHFIKMTWEHLIFFRSNYQNVLHWFIRENIESYVNIMNTNRVVQKELLTVLDMDIDDSMKKQLIDLASPISIQGKPYSDDVKLYILEKKLASEDLPYLYQEYATLSDSLQYFTRRRAVRHLESIPNIPLNACPELVCDLLDKSTLSRALKLQLLYSNLKKDISKETACAYLTNYHREDLAQLLCTAESPQIPKEPFEINQTILGILKQKNWIKDYRFNATREVFEITRNPVWEESETAKPH